MRIRVQKWGNGLALRIPKSFAERMGLETGSVVSVSLVEGKLVIHAGPPEAPMLKKLLRDVAKANLHGEWDTGPALGREHW